MAQNTLTWSDAQRSLSVTAIRDSSGGGGYHFTVTHKGVLIAVGWVMSGNLVTTAESLLVLANELGL